MKSLKCFILFVLFLLPNFVFGMHPANENSVVKLEIEAFLENALSRNIPSAHELKEQMDRYVGDGAIYTKLLEFMHRELSVEDKTKIHNVYEKKLWNIGFDLREEEMLSLVNKFRLYVSNFESTLASDEVQLNGNSYKGTSDGTSSSISDDSKDTTSSSSESPRRSETNLPENFHEFDENGKISAVVSLGESAVPEKFAFFIATALIKEGLSIEDLQAQAKKYLTEAFADYAYRGALKNKINADSMSDLERVTRIGEVRFAYDEFKRKAPDLFSEHFKGFLRFLNLEGNISLKLLKDQLRKMTEENYNKVIHKLYDKFTDSEKDYIYKQAKFLSINKGVSLPNKTLNKIIATSRGIVSNFEMELERGLPKVETKKVINRKVEVKKKIEELNKELVKLTVEKEKLIDVKTDSKLVNKRIKELDKKIVKLKKKIELLQGKKN